MPNLSFLLSPKTMFFAAISLWPALAGAASGAQAAKAPAWPSALGFCLAAVAIALAVYSRRSVASLTAQKEQAEADVAKMRIAAKEAEDQAKEAKKRRDDRTQALSQNKGELDKQKKRNHTLKEELRVAQQKLKAQADELAQAIRSQNQINYNKESNPEDAPKVARAARIAIPERRPKPASVEKAAPAETEKNQATPEHKTQLNEAREQADKALAVVRKLERELTQIREELATQSTGNRQKGEQLAKMRKKLEGQRRVELITANQMELLEDKLRTMGRRYYDSLSEVAALRGDVAPPKSAQFIGHASPAEGRFPIQTAPIPAENPDQAATETAQMPVETVPSSSEDEPKTKSA